MDIIADIIKDLVREHYGYISECEAESTETERQIALIRARTKELQAHTELAEAYFSRQMQERERLFRSASAVLKKAIEQGNVEIARIALKTIEIVHHKSPFSF